MLWKIRDERHTQPNTIYGYDERHRLVSVTQKQQLLGGADLVTSYGYDAHDNLVSVTDPNLNVTTYVYDDFGRLRTQVSPVSGTTSYTYDPAGNLVTSADAVLASTTRTYDAANRITSAASTKPGAISETVTWQYDDTTSAAYRRGRLWRMTDPTGSVEYAYERRGLLRQEARVLYGTPYGQGYAHDADGNRSQVTYPSGRVVAFGFDFAGRPITAGATAPTARSYVAAATYYPFGPRRTLSLGNGTLQAKGYDQRYQLTQNGYRRGPLTWYFDQAIDPDASGNVLSVTEGYAGFGDRAFTYDDLSRLRRADAPYQWGVDSTNGYTYDAMGNLLSLRLGATRTASFAHSGSTPLLTSVTENGTPTSVSYDDAGSIDLIGSTTYGTSARGYLEGIDNGISYAYDGAGLRRRRLVKDSEKSRYYFYTPDLHLLSESALASGSPGLAEDYVWLGDTPVAHETLGNGNTEWFATDSLGTPILGTDSSKEETFRLELEPYGRVWWISQNKTKLDRRILRYPGQEQEDDTPPLRDRYYNVFRWYLPTWGSYSQPDPVGLRGGLGLFGYVGGNPISWADRLGLYRRGDVIYRCPPAGVPGACDVVVVFHDFTPDEDNNGDEIILAYGNPAGCKGPCSGRAHFAFLNGASDPYPGYEVRGVCSTGISFDRLVKRWQRWQRKDPPWTEPGQEPPSQCYTLANALTGTDDWGPLNEWFTEWGPRNTTYWKRRCGGY